jgi:hypothetical protein
MRTLAKKNKAITRISLKKALAAARRNRKKKRRPRSA